MSKPIIDGEMSSTTDDLQEPPEVQVRATDETETHVATFEYSGRHPYDVPEANATPTMTEAEQLAAETAHRWNCYPLLVEALEELLSFIGTPTSNAGEAEIRGARYALERAKVGAVAKGE